MARRGSSGGPGAVGVGLRVLAAPWLGLLFVVGLPILGLAAIASALIRPAPGTPARPAGGPASGHREPRSPRPAA